ncbi:bacteriocin immunity protein [Pseudomonas sp. ZT5P21]
MKKTISDFTEVEFITFVSTVLAANTSPDEILDPLLFEFERLCEHPAGSDLIYWPEDMSKNPTAESITETVKNWRESKGLPGFKR